MKIHGTIGNQRVNSLLTSAGATPSSLQRQQGTTFDINTVDWSKGVAAAESLANKRDNASKARALNYYKSLVVRATAQVTAPAPLLDKKPTTKDIRWSWKTGGKWGATVDPKLVDNHPGDHWKWILFNPSAVPKDETWTISAIVHELDHAAHALALYEAWKKEPKKPQWDTFYVNHFDNWTEKAIKVGEAAGVVGAIGGLPSKIRPSAIEFRAYTEQLVQFFHKYEHNYRDLVVKGTVLHYPLKKQAVAATIADPALDLATARQKLLDYFNDPPVADKARKRAVKILLAAAFKGAVLLFRPAGDQEQMKKDFKDIFDFQFTREERRQVFRTYKP